ncbi:class I SAM-dependent methyltransferase [Salinimicrobium oceani]|uniref:Class I SAM-dependent methyltransferase n=1 Tax=Salinimicrobium oceani TaxID=2722702 RepID=A0ABX1CWF1_9FLAO|nr:class I SAM-dependent methyltransferase [Salinimicrobium oceani]NJW52260.1 class I SAM-dependent methyltransferase [Salinimicrobium oceani]
MDPSNGYEKIAEQFLEHREHDVERTGASAVSGWAKTLAPAAAVLDLGCGSGIPISQVFMEAGMKVYGIDASPTMIGRFRSNFPGSNAACESIEQSSFFDRSFDAIIAWGLLFLLPENSQESLIKKVAGALKPHGKFLFTAPHQKVEWTDVMSKHTSRSLGGRKYRKLISENGLSLMREFDDKAGNHYFCAEKI